MKYKKFVARPLTCEAVQFFPDDHPLYDPATCPITEIAVRPEEEMDGESDNYSIEDLRDFCKMEVGCPGVMRASEATGLNEDWYFVKVSDSDYMEIDPGDWIIYRNWRHGEGDNGWSSLPDSAFHAMNKEMK